MFSNRPCAVQHDARGANSSRRCTTVTFVENFARKIASSIAESPPPTTIRRAILEERGVAVAQ